MAWPWCISPAISSTIASRPESLQPHLAEVLGRERFLREIRVAAQLRHPNLLPLYDSGDAEGSLYYVIPYVEGGSLRDRLILETRLGMPTALRLTREVAEALDYAHRPQRGPSRHKAGEHPAG